MVWLGIIMMREIYIIINNMKGDLMINFITNLAKL